MSKGSAKKRSDKESRWFCTAEWHTAQLKSRLAAPIYTLAMKFSRNSGIFSASAVNLAQYFGVHRNTIDRALDDLRANRLFEPVRSERGRATIYRPIRHEEWAAANPGFCIRQIEYPWKGEGDPLGRQLYALSGERVKFFPRQMTGLRNLGFSDEQIITEFRGFMARATYVGNEWKRAYFDFRDYLKTAGNMHSPLCTPRGKAAQPTVHVRAQPAVHYSTKGFSEGKSDSTIPAKAAALRPPSTFDSEAKPRNELSLIIGLKPPTPLSQEECARRKRDQKEALARHLASREVKSA
jgi:hypothetical protein